MEHDAAPQNFTGYLFDVPAVPKAPRLPRREPTVSRTARVEEVSDFLTLGSAECDISIGRFYEWGSRPSKWTVYPIDQRPDGYIACDKDGKWCRQATKPRWDDHAINDPRRPDWGIFAEILQRPIEVPSNQHDARWAMKQALIESYQFDAGRSLMAACAPRQIAGFQKEFRGQADALDTLSQRLLNINSNAAPSNPKKIKDPTQGNSNYCIHYWEPTKSGIVAYIAFRLKGIISDIIEERMKEPKTVSLNALAEKNVEVTGDGTLIHSEAFASDRDDPDAHSHDAAPSEPNRELGEPIFTPSGRPVMRTEWRRKDSPEQLGSKGRSDYDYFSVISGARVKPAKTPEARCAQVKELAREVIESALPAMEPDEREAIMEDLEAWDPAKDTFTRHFPDVAESALEAKFASPAQADMDAATNAIAGYADAPGPGASKAEHLSFANQQIRESAVWLARATPEDLNDPARPDYQFFCERMQEDPDDDLRGSALHKRIKEMAMQWTALTLQNQPHGPYVMRRVRDWDPAKDGFYHEMIQEMLAERPRAMMDMLNPAKAELARTRMAEKALSKTKSQEMPGRTEIGLGE